MSLTPLVSIIIPVYNGSNYLREAIDSALAQTYQNIEILVINDGSNDDGATEAIAQSYGNKIRYFSKLNGGVSTALNLGIKNMKGQYFSWLSHDDLYYPNKIERQMNLVNSLQQIADDNYIIASNVEILFENGLKNRPQIHKNTFKHIGIFLATSARVGLNGCSLLIPKAVLDHNQFDARKKFTQDYDLWFRLRHQCKFYLVPECLVISRRHNQQDSNHKVDQFTKEADNLHFEMLNQLTEDEFSQYFKEFGCIKHCYKNFEAYLRSGYLQTAGLLLKKLLVYTNMNHRISFWWIFNKNIKWMLFGQKTYYSQLVQDNKLDEMIKQIVQTRSLRLRQSATNSLQKLFRGVASDGLIFTIQRLIKKIHNKITG